LCALIDSAPKQAKEKLDRPENKYGGLYDTCKRKEEFSKPTTMPTNFNKLKKI
jgi:hypothetical protein